MAYDEGLACRVREHFENRADVSEKKMFGGLCFMVRDHMCCGIVDNTLMGRVGPNRYEQCLAQPYVNKMDFTGRPMKGMIYVSPEGISEDSALAGWLNICTDFIETLPPKKAKKV